MKIKKIKPMFTGIVTTANKYVEDQTSSGLVTDVKKLKSTLMEYQTVIAVGSSVRDINPGDVVCVNPSRYANRKFKENSLKNDIMENTITGYNFNVVEIDGNECLLLDQGDITFVVESYED